MSNQPLRVIVTGATKPLGLTHPKLKEVIHADFYDLSAVETQLSGYNACFFCLGVSSVGKPAEEYYKATYTLTMEVARTLSRLNPAEATSASRSDGPSNQAGGMVFCYVSGAGTDSTEKGRSRWARVKGKTENDLMKLPFRRVYAFRPGFIKPTKGLRHAHPFYRYINWMFPLGRALFPNGFVTLSEVGKAMIYLTLEGDASAIVPGKAIIRYASLNSSHSS